jgi:mRNA-degrading endonuclease toxin of MazEF toxin-antitoxin module
MFGDIFLCQFPFTSGASGKIRPALLLFDLKDDAIICRVTSILHNQSLDVLLNDWASAGLLKPSVARLDRVVTAERTIFLKQLGTLSTPDREAVRTTWNANMKL